MPQYNGSPQGLAAALSEILANNAEGTPGNASSSMTTPTLPFAISPGQQFTGAQYEQALTPLVNRLVGVGMGALPTAAAAAIGGPAAISIPGAVMDLMSGLLPSRSSAMLAGAGRRWLPLSLAARQLLEGSRVVDESGAPQRLYAPILRRPDVTAPGSTGDEALVRSMPWASTQEGGSFYGPRAAENPATAAQLAVRPGTVKTLAPVFMSIRQPLDLEGKVSAPQLERILRSTYNELVNDWREKGLDQGGKRQVPISYETWADRIWPGGASGGPLIKEGAPARPLLTSLLSHLSPSWVTRGLQAAGIDGIVYSDPKAGKTWIAIGGRGGDVNAQNQVIPAFQAGAEKPRVSLPERLLGGYGGEIPPELWNHDLREVLMRAMAGGR